MRKTFINNRSERKAKQERDAFKLAALFFVIWILSGDGWMDALFNLFTWLIQ